MMKVLVFFATRYGATAGTTEEIASILREEGFSVKVVNSKEEKVMDISEYELVVIGSSLQMERWTAETGDFLKKFQKDLRQKKVSIFVSSALKSLYEREGKKEDLEKLRLYLKEEIAKYALNPIAVGIFGGVMDYNKMGLIARKTFGSMKTRFEAAGFKETKPGVYDTRDWKEIYDWTKTLVLKARYL